MSLQRGFSFHGEAHAGVEMFGGAVAVNGELEAATAKGGFPEATIQNLGADAEALMGAEDGEVDEPGNSVRPIDQDAADALAGFGNEDAVYGEGVLPGVGVGAELELRFEYCLHLLLVHPGSEEDPRALFREEAEQQGLIDLGDGLESNGLGQVRCHYFRRGERAEGLELVAGREDADQGDDEVHDQVRRHVGVGL